MRPRLLDLFSGAGGCAVGYDRAGFEVVGVDIEPQPNYPFPFVEEDALTALEAYMEEGDGSFAAIHASPPCQDYSSALRHMAAAKPRLIDPVKAALIASGLPWVIENVVGAPLPTQADLFGAHGVVLCGSAFGMRTHRHRIFETSFPVPSRGCQHTRLALNPHNQAGRDRIYEEFGRQDPEKVWRKDMGVEWMTKHEARESVPPAFTEHVGHYLLASLNAKAAA